MKNNSLIYLDNQSTTPIDPIVLESMKLYLTESFGNPASASHAFGWKANEAIEIAREKIANIINAQPNEIIFTSGATESINIGLQGLINKMVYPGDHIITTNIEHKAVIDVLNAISKQGVEVTFVPVQKNGIIESNKLKKYFKKNTKLCTVIHGNNEIGSIQPIEKIGQLCRKNNVIFHVDVAQTLGKRIIDVNKMNIDLLSISGHKIYAPKGIGALFVRRKNPRIELKAILHGGGQEYGYRPGTLSVHNIVGLGTACELANKNYITDNNNIHKMKMKLLDGLKEVFPNLIINGSLQDRLEGNLNITFPKYSAEKIMMRLSEIACSTGSACTSSTPLPSHVLLALKLKKEQINNTIRFGIGKFNTIEEIDRTISLFKQKFKRN